MKIYVCSSSVRVTIVRVIWINFSALRKTRATCCKLYSNFAVNENVKRITARIWIEFREFVLNPVPCALNKCGCSGNLMIATVFSCQCRLSI